MCAMIQQKGNSGKHLSNVCPYGYVKDELNKDKWLLDEYAAGIVKRIFEMFLSGVNMAKIADTLCEEEILRPHSYKHHVDDDIKYKWQCRTIKNILVNQEYCGDTVNFKTRRVSYKNKKIIKAPPEEWKIFYNTHTAIISREDFEEVQKRFDKRPRRKRDCSAALFSDLIFCLDCKAKFHIFHVKEKIAYECTSYRKRHAPCTFHRIYEKELKACVFEQIKKLCREANDDLQMFKSKVQTKFNAEKTESIKKVQQELAKSQKRIAEIDNYVQALFESKVKNEITSEVFGSLSKKYMNEKAKLNIKVSDLICEEAKFKDENLKLNQLFTAIKKYSSADELTREMLTAFVERIEVGKHPKRGDHNKTQEIYIFFYGVGLVKLP